MDIAIDMCADRSRRASASRPMLAAALAVAMAASCLADEVSWNAGNGNWDDPANWTPFGVPDNDDVICIGNLPGVENSVVTLMAPGSGFDELYVTNGMTLDMNHHELVSFGLASITGTGSRIIARPDGGGFNQQDFNGTLHVGVGAHFELVGNVPVRLHGASDSHGTISGRGFITVSSTIPFENDGIIDPSNNGGLTIQAGHFPDQEIDLDGASGVGHLLLDLPFSGLTVLGEALTDPFSGEITMARGAGLAIDTAQDWACDASCEINIIGDYDPTAASQIWGAPFSFNGTLNVNSFEAHLRILSDVTFQANADVTVAYTDWLELDGTTTVEGGDFLLGNQGVFDFDGPTVMMGGTFDSNSNDPINGAFDLNGGTTWNGGCTVDGVMRQYGNAFVAGPSVITAETFDMDGHGNTQWTVWNEMTIDADSLQTVGSEDFYGTVDIASVSGKLTIVKPAWDPLFSMAGEMNLIGHPAIFYTRYAGSNLDLIGALNASGKVAMDGHLRAFGGEINIADPGDVLRLDDGGHITSACLFTGDGELRIGAGSDPLFNDANTNGVGILNQGVLLFQSNLTTHRFTGETGSEWDVSIHGTDQGVDYDHFIVATQANLGGDLRVRFFDPYEPDPADVYTIMTADSIAGAFDNVASGERLPCVGGSFLVTYGAATNTVVLSDWIPCPADLNGDGVVNTDDLLIVLGAWGLSEADIDGDGVTDVTDMLILLAAWGACP